MNAMASLSTEPSYEAYRIKRNRSSKAEVEARRASLIRIVDAQAPMTVRQVFYRATVEGVVEKTEAGYDKVQRDLALLRRSGDVSYFDITDNTRFQRRPRTFGSVEQALQDTARLYRKSLWAEADAYIEIWLEKDALSGVIYPVTSQYDVSLMVARGYASLSFLHSAADAISDLTVPAYIYHLGDFDPSGVNAGEKIEETLRDLAPAAEIHFERLGITCRQIAMLGLPTRPTKKSDSRHKGFGDISVELDAMEPEALRQLVCDAIEHHLPPAQFEILKAAEQSEREIISRLVGGLTS
jgi:hypothetical protein